MEQNDEADADSASIFPQLLIIVLLTIINAFLAASELAIISCNKVKIGLLAEKGNKKAKVVQKLNLDQTKFLSTIQVGITLAGFFSSATAAANISDDLAVWIQSIGIPYSTQIAFVFITLILSFFTLIFGELFPKRLALAFPEKIALGVAKPINFLKIIMTPFVKFLSGTCNLLVKITGLSKVKTDERISEEEIKSVIETGVTDGTLDSQKQKMMESVLKFNDLTAMDIMTPRVATAMIDIDDDINYNLNKVFEENYTRIPVYKDTQDQIIGILNIKDLVRVLATQETSTIDIKKLIREPLFVIDRVKINKLFQMMKESKNQIAILLDEFGGFTGIATMEDIIEEVVGNIYDEYDDESTFVKISDVEFIVDGNTPIQEINRELDLELDEDNSEYDTIAGLIISRLDRFPLQNEELEFTEEKIKVIVEKVSPKRIERLKIIIIVNEENQE